MKLLFQQASHCLKSTKRSISWALGILFIYCFSANLACASSSMKTHFVAPKSLVGSTLIMQIENLTSTVADLYPTKGVISQRYLDYKSVKAEYVGGQPTAGFDLYYRYHRTRKNKAIEYAINPESGTQYITEYTFTSSQGGYWERKVKYEDTRLSGRFTLSPNHPESYLAPETLANLTVGLSVIEAKSDEFPYGSFPVPGTVILQSYQDMGNYSGHGFGLGTVDHEGTYRVTRVGANVLVEETIQNIPSVNITAPYTMVYTFDTPYSGTWYQNFSDGLIIFSGYFTTFETQ